MMPARSRDGALMVTAAQARAYLLRRPGALYPAAGPAEEPAALVRELGYLQIDPVAVVAANHHLIARTRLPAYAPAHLDAALYERRALVETFPSIHAILPMADWRFYDRRTGPPTRYEQRDPAMMQPLMERILATIRARGPLASRDFLSEDDRASVEYGWGKTTKAQMALQTLLRRGFLMVHHRAGAQRVYDLTERVLPPDVDLTAPTEEERAHHYALRELRYGGLVMGTTTRIKPAIAAGDAMPVAVAGIRAPFFVPSDQWDTLAGVMPIAEEERRAVLLAPLDPLIWDRKRLAALWGFDYTWEVYVPAAKRKYGPYTLPVLWGDRFVARLDPSLDRKRRVLVVRNLWFEPDAPRDPALYADLAAEIIRFAAFHGDAAVALGDVSPVGHVRSLRAALRRVVDGTGAPTTAVS